MERVTSNNCEFLQYCVVKIFVPNRQGWGTGFFVAPHLILTCYHVVGDVQTVRVLYVPENRETQATAIEIAADADLALLELPEALVAENILATLGTAYNSRDPFYTFGYPNKDFSEGAPVTAECEGETNENGISLIKFKAGQICPGLSGSPLYNQRTQQICGVVKFTRDSKIDLGGGAISLTSCPESWQNYFTLQSEQALQPKIFNSLRALVVNFTDWVVQNVQEKQNKNLQNYYDWEDSPNLKVFVGRKEEINTLKKIILEDNYNLVGIVGIGGIGKTDLAKKLAKEIQGEFNFLIWRSLRDAPNASDLLSNVLSFFIDSLQKEKYKPQKLIFKDKISLLCRYLKEYKCLLILDNFESFLESSQNSVEIKYLDEYLEYKYFLEKINNLPSESCNSCVLLTSRERPPEIDNLELNNNYLLDLRGLPPIDGKQIFQRMHGFTANSEDDWKHLITLYDGNPLALRFVAKLIREDYNGEVSQFLNEGNPVFRDIEKLFDWHFERLSEAENELLNWLALNREPVNKEDLKIDILSPENRDEISSNLHKLQDRIPLEKVTKDKLTAFTLQPVLIEYINKKLIGQFFQEIKAILSNTDTETQKTLKTLERYLLLKGQDQEYVKQAKYKLIISPILERLSTSFGQEEIIDRLKSRIQWKSQNQTLRSKRNYKATNLLHLLQFLKADLTENNFSNLILWNTNFRYGKIQGINLSNSDLSQSSFIQHFSSVLSVAFSPNNNYLATGDDEGKIYFWKFSQYRFSLEKKFFGHTEWIRSISFSTKNNIFASASDDKTVRIWDITKENCCQVLKGHKDWVRSVTISSDGKFVISGSDDSTIKIWSVETGETIQSIKLEKAVYSVALSADASFLASGNADFTVRLWKVNLNEEKPSLQEKEILKGHTHKVWSVAFSADGRFLATGSEDETIIIWRIGDRTTELRKLEGHNQRVRSVAFSPDNHLLASASHDRTIKLWDVENGTLIKTLQGHTNYVRSVAFSTDGRILASGSDDKTAKIWQISQNQFKYIQNLQGYTNWILSVAFGYQSGQDILATGSEDHIVRIWNVSKSDHSNRQVRHYWEGHDNWVLSVAFSPDSNLLASAGQDNTILIWSISENKCIHRIEQHEDRIWSVVFNHNGNLLASGSEEGNICIWDFQKEKCIKCFQHDDRVWSIDFSPDSLTIASGSESQGLTLWNLEDDSHLPRQISQPEHNIGRVWSVAFHPSGKYIATGSDDSTVRIWNYQTGQCDSIFEGHENRIRCVTFSPSGEWIASGSEDNTIRIWQLNRHNTNFVDCQILQEHNSWVRSLAFNKKGTVMASCSQDGTVKLWDLNQSDNIQCKKTLWIDRPYEGINIKGVKGLSQAQIDSLKSLGAIDE